MKMTALNKNNCVMRDEKSKKELKHETTNDIRVQVGR